MFGGLTNIVKAVAEPLDAAADFVAAEVETVTKPLTDTARDAAKFVRGE